MRINNGLRRFSLRHAIEHLHEACLVRIALRRFAIRLDPFGMLGPQVVVNLLPELRVGVDLMRRRVELGTPVRTLHFETNEFHKRLSIWG